MAGECQRRMKPRSFRTAGNPRKLLNGLLGEKGDYTVIWVLQLLQLLVTVITRMQLWTGVPTQRKRKSLFRHHRLESA